MWNQPRGAKRVKTSELYDVNEDKVVRKRQNCPRCGEGVFLAEHKDRSSCGKCGYTQFKK
ncbi:MAG: 30S ribosomal protein S27ae [Euryarchaeota archaeon]